MAFLCKGGVIVPGKNYHDAQTVHYVCPFFRSERGNVICCEGVAPQSSNKTCFTRRSALLKYRSRYCFGFRYEQCHWGETLLRRKYPDQPAG